jgi:uncharacterized protein
MYKKRLGNQTRWTTALGLSLCRLAVPVLLVTLWTATRYGAYPAMWLVSADGTGKEPVTEPAGLEVQEWDAYGQPTGIHYSPFCDRKADWTDDPRFGFHENRSYHDAEWLDFQWCQTGHGGEHLPYKVRRMHDYKPTKAVANGEPTYERIGRPDKATGWWQGDEAWLNLTAGGTMGVVYGAGGLWNWKIADDEPGWPNWANSQASWADAIEFEGSRYVGYVGRALAGYDLADMAILPEIGPQAVGKPGELYIVYLPEGGTTTLADLKRALPCRWFNPRSGEFAGEGCVNPKSPSLTAPSDEPWVLLAGRWNPQSAAGDPAGAVDIGGARRALADYQGELEAFRREFAVSERVPDVAFFLFGMGARAKHFYQGGYLREAPGGRVVRRWAVREEIVVPSEYRVVLALADGGTAQIREDERGVWIVEDGRQTLLEGTDAQVNLPPFEGHRYPRIMRVLHQELLVNVVGGQPVPNLFVYPKAWLRDAAMMGMAFEATGNLHVIREWILGLREVYDRNNAGEEEADNLGQALYLVSLVSDRSHPLVEKALAEAPRWEVSEGGLKHIKGRSDFAEHPVYQTKWLKFGLRSLGLPDPYSVPVMKDSYSALFWWDYRDVHVAGRDARDRGKYPYLGWAVDHFYGEKGSPISSRDYPLTWEQRASQAIYAGLDVIDPVFAKEKIAAPHTWHAAEVFLYLLNRTVSHPAGAKTPHGHSSSGSRVGGYPIQFAPFASVMVNDSFWQPILERNRTVTIPHVLKMCEHAGMFRDFDRAAGRLDGPAEALLISDETVYKAIEAAALELARRPDSALAGRIDSLIARIAAAQEPDGYLHTPYQIAKRLGKPVPPPFSDNGRGLELYFCGHLYEAAAAHYLATGRNNLLAVAIKNAELVNRVFGPGKRVDVAEHPEIEPALVKLYEATGDERWWQLARFFVETRGTTAGGRRLRGPFSQDHAPIREQTEAVGQAPRATYFYSGVVDVAALGGDATLLPPMRRLWDDVAGRKLYLTGGIGSRHGNEGFGDPYELPNLAAYTEVCAAVSFSMWNERMFRATGDAQFVDALERTLYNNFLAGVSLSGDRYFYACPPQSDGKYAFNRGWLPRDRKGPHMHASATRKEWFECACCPPNWARWVVQVPGFIYATRANDLFVNLYVTSETSLEIGGGRWKVKQETNYPWDGRVRLSLTSDVQDPASEIAVRLRLPGWARGEPVAGDLYRYLDNDTPQPVRLRVNGEPEPVKLENGYAVLRRAWKTGDEVELDLPMPVRRVAAHAAVKDLAGQVAVERGPIVYCVEGVDHEGRVLDLALPDDVRLDASFDAGFAGGVIVVRGQARRGDQRVELRLIPHFAWANRGVTEMTVWINRSNP